MAEEKKEPSREEIAKARLEYIARYGGGKVGKEPTALQKHLGAEFDEMYANYKPRKWRLTKEAEKDKTRIPFACLKVDEAAVEAKINNRLAPDLCTVPTFVEIVN